MNKLEKAYARAQRRLPTRRQRRKRTALNWKRMGGIQGWRTTLKWKRVVVGWDADAEFLDRLNTLASVDLLRLTRPPDRA